MPCLLLYLNKALEKAMRDVWDCQKMEIYGERIGVRGCHRDNERDKIVNKTFKLLRASESIGLRVNVVKTKYCFCK